MDRKYLLKKQPHDNRDILKAVPISLASCPAKFDLSMQMPPVLDQGSLGSCALNATSNTLRFLLKREKLTEWQPSRLYLYWNTRVNIENESPNEDTGVCIRDVCKSLQKYHACHENPTWPYDITKFNVAPPLIAYKDANLHMSVKYTAVPQNLLSIKTTISEGYPIIIGIQVYESFESEQSIKTGIIPYPNINNEKCLGGHAVVLVAYDDSTQKFLFQNSWGSEVGQKGFFEIDYKYILDSNLGSDFWMISLFS